MCGIAGFMFRDHRPKEDTLREMVWRMTETLHHRGPDGSGVWTNAEAGIALGHRRLAILDLTKTGAQPMRSHCGRFVLTYNGEVYNFRELRQELEAVGHTFRGHSDTEVVLTAIVNWGIERALQRVNGMFAFGLWDQETRTLTVARDRAGKKPLYYGWCGDTFLFGSELKALRAHPDFDPEIDRDALGLLIQYSWIPGPYSIYKRIRKLSPGSLLTVTQRNRRHPDSPTTYWSARQIAERGECEPYQGSADEAATALNALLKDAVSHRMIADVEVGALLSGGIDSTTVVSFMQTLSPRPVKTFSIGFHEPKFNETQHAKAIAHHLGTDHTELYVTAQDSIAVIPELATIYDEPFADPSQIPTSIVSKLAHSSVKVVLSGDGGDELFAGYKRYRKCLRQWELLRPLPHFLTRNASRAMKAIGQMNWRLVDPCDRQTPREIPTWKRFGAKLEKVARHIGASNLQELFARMHMRCQEPADFVVGAVSVPTAFTDPGQWADVAEPLQTMVYMDFVDYMTDDILVKVDRASMAVGLEVRCPLLDYRVAEFAWSLPMFMRMNPSGGKQILRRVLEHYVPRELTERPKMGFGVPVAEWVRGPLHEWAEDLLDEKRMREQGFLQPEAVRRIWRQHLTGWRNHDVILWSLLMFQSWYKAKT